MKLINLMILILFLVTNPAYGEESIDYVIVAKDFLHKLEQGKIESISSMVTDDLVFEDPTFGVSYQGKEAVLAMYPNYIGNARNFNKYLTSAYKSSDTVVLNYIYYVEMNISTNAETDQYRPVMGEGTRIITFRNGLISRHMDLADYQSIFDSHN